MGPVDISISQIKKLLDKVEETRNPLDLKGARSALSALREFISTTGTPNGKGENCSLIIEKKRLSAIADVLKKKGYGDIAANICDYGSRMRTDKLLILSTGALTAWISKLPGDKKRTEAIFRLPADAEVISRASKPMRMSVDRNGILQV